jgi:hypothetical protein
MILMPQKHGFLGLVAPCGIVNLGIPVLASRALAMPLHQTL